MRFQCDACKEFFQHPAKQTETTMSATITVPLSQLDNQGTDATYSPKTVTKNTALEFNVCPFCQSKKYSEAPEQPQQISNVYIYELGTGPQTELDGLLAQGYVIVSRYSKQYHLEKPKEAQP